jgi:hypothetical protein
MAPLAVCWGFDEGQNIVGLMPIRRLAFAIGEIQPEFQQGTEVSDEERSQHDVWFARFSPSQVARRCTMNSFSVYLARGGDFRQGVCLEHRTNLGSVLASSDRQRSPS